MKKWLLLFLLITIPIKASYEFVLPKDGIFELSGNGQKGGVGESLKMPLRVQLIDSETKVPVVGKEVFFESVLGPLDSLKKKQGKMLIQEERVYTDKDGYAQTKATLGSLKGFYVVMASAQDALSIHFSLEAKDSQWIFLLILEMLAGLSFFLFGISLLSTGMRDMTGHYLRKMAQSFAQNRVAALIVGIVVTLLFQSSSATTVMLVGFVQAGIFKAVQTLGMILGAAIGSTLTVQLIAFQISDYALLMFVFGFFMNWICVKSVWKNGGLALMGLGILFFGMKMMSHATSDLRTFPLFFQAISSLKSPLTAILVGTIFTAVIQSSAGFFGIVFALASQGLVGLEMGIALGLGANIGTCITAILASLRSGVEGKRVAWSHALFKIFGVILLIGFIKPFAGFVEYVSQSSDIVREIANAHTIFNIALSLLFIPFLTYFYKIVEFLVPDKETRSPQLFDHSLALSPALGISAAKAEIMRLGFKVRHMLEMSFDDLFVQQNHSEEVIRMEKEVDEAHRQIREFLKNMTARQKMNPQAMEEALVLMHIVNDLEQISDSVKDRVVPLMGKLREYDLMFSRSGLAEIKEYHLKTVKQIGRALEVLESFDLAQAEHVSVKFKRYKSLAMELQRTHFARLQSHVQESEATTEIHLDLLSTLLNITDLATNIARYLLESIDTPYRQETHSIILKKEEN